MSGVENDTLVEAPPARVWRLLTDFAHYRDWHPFNRITGEARQGAAIDYQYTSTLVTKRARHSPATISRLEPNAVLEWETGIRHVFQHIESYELTPDPKGTRLRHRIEYRGALAWLMRGRPSKQAHARICETDAALRSYLTQKKPSTAHRPANRPSRRRR